jgi:aspartate aminotransferase
MKCSADIAHGLLHQAHVATVAGEGFGTTEHVRFSYATSMENLDKALGRMRKFFGGL